MGHERSQLLASVGLGFEFADHQVINASQGGLFDDGDHGSATQEPPLAQAEPWGVRERLLLEKSAIGFFLSGHLFQEYEAEVRRFCKRQVADLVDSRDLQVLAGIVNRMDRTYAAEASCGEIRLIYRLTRINKRTLKQSPHKSRLPGLRSADTSIGFKLESGL